MTTMETTAAGVAAGAAEVEAARLLLARGGCGRKTCWPPRDRAPSGADVRRVHRGAGGRGTAGDAGVPAVLEADRCRLG